MFRRSMNLRQQHVVTQENRQPQKTSQNSKHYNVAPKLTSPLWLEYQLRWPRASSHWPRPGSGWTRTGGQTAPTESGKLMSYRYRTLNI